MRPKAAIRLLLLTGALTAPASLLSAEAEAASGIYIHTGLGFGSFTGDALRIYEAAPDIPVVGDGCCPGGGFAFDLRTGFALFHLVAPEFVFTGDIFGMGSARGTGGGGFIGGGVRLFPLGIFELAGMPFDLPLDFSFGVDFGYAIVGKDFAYTGSFVSFDGAFEYRFSDLFGLGARLMYAIPSYRDFVFTDYNNNLGKCLDSSASVTGPVVSEGAADCSGRGPTAAYLSPSIYASFVIDLF